MRFYFILFYFILFYLSAHPSQFTFSTLSKNTTRELMHWHMGLCKSKSPLPSHPAPPPLLESALTQTLPPLLFALPTKNPTPPTLKKARGWFYMYFLFILINKARLIFPSKKNILFPLPPFLCPSPISLLVQNKFTLLPPLFSLCTRKNEIENKKKIIIK